MQVYVMCGEPAPLVSVKLGQLKARPQKQTNKQKFIQPYHITVLELDFSKTPLEK